MAIISWRMFRFTFEIICLIGVALMVGFWFYKYEVEDRDIGVVDYESLGKADVELPALSLRFQKPVLMDVLNNSDPNVNATVYLKFLEGDVYDARLAHIDYFNVTLDLNKYFLFAMVRLFNESYFRQEEKITTINHETIFNGLMYGSLKKCFAAEIKKKDLPSNIKLIRYYYNHSQLLKDLPQGYTVIFNLYYPGQYLLHITNGLTLNSAKRLTKILLNIADIEYLRRRNTRNKQCMNPSKKFDDMVWKKHITRNGCRAPYDRPYDSFPKCAEKEDIQRSMFDFFVVGSKYYPKACQRISKLTFSLDNFYGTKGRSAFILVYPDDVKIITQSKEVDIHSLIGNIGGYIGLFLGNNGISARIIIVVFVKIFTKKHHAEEMY